MTDAKQKRFPKKFIDSIKWYVERIIKYINSKNKPQTNSQGRKPFIKDISTAYAENWRYARCVFYLSTGRVGTETLTALLNASPDIEAVHEPSPRLIYASYQAFIEGIDKYSIDKWKELVLAARDDYVLHANQKGKIYIETNNRLTYLASALAKAFPASKFIYVHRHPYDVIRSGMRRGYYSHHPGDFARYHPHHDDLFYEDWNSFSLLEKNAWYWDRVNRDASHFLETLLEGRALELRSADLFKGDVNTLQGLYDFIGVIPPSKEIISEILGKRLNKQNDGDFPPATDWGQNELERVRNIVGDTSQRLRYPL